MADKQGSKPDTVAAELADIKQLLVLLLLRAGVKQGQIAAALGVSEATISRSLPKGLGNAVKGTQRNGAIG